MMKIVFLTTGLLRTNSYLIFKEGEKDAILIDAGGDVEKIMHVARENGVTIKHLLLTHGHFDHIGACAELKRQGAKIYIHELDKRKVETDESLCGFSGIKVEKFTPDVVLRGGEELLVSGFSVKVLHTPGHTSGSVCYVLSDVIFSGDTLFSQSFGRTDLGDGNIKLLSDSIINKLFTLDGNYTVYPGHDSATDLDTERRLNPIFYYV